PGRSGSRGESRCSGARSRSGPQGPGTRPLVGEERSPARPACRYRPFSPLAYSDSALGMVVRRARSLRAFENSLRSALAVSAGMPKCLTRSSTICSLGTPCSRSWKILEPEALSEKILPFLISRTIPPSGVCTLRGRSGTGGMKTSHRSAHDDAPTRSRLPEEIFGSPESLRNVREAEVGDDERCTDALLRRIQNRLRSRPRSPL